MANEHLSNNSISELLRNIAVAYQLKGGPTSHFKIIAYQKVADTVEQLSRELFDIWKEGKLYLVPGIGAGIGSGLEEVFKNGKSKYFSEILKGIPETVFILMKIPGIGPKKAFKLVMQFGLLDPKLVTEELKKLAKENKIADLDGFGEKSQLDILEGIEVFERVDKNVERMPLPFARAISEELSEYLVQLGDIVKKIDVLGSLRRQVSTIGDIDIAVVCETKDMKMIVEHFIKFPGMRSVEAAGDNKASIIATRNIRIDLRLQDEESFGSMLQYFTGSKAHNIKLREYALKKGYTLNEFGMKKIRNSTKDVIPTKVGIQTGSPIPTSPRLRWARRVGDDKVKAFKNEELLYSFLGLQIPPPELREGGEEIELAKKNKLPKLLELTDIRGDFHIHSSYDLHTSHDLGLNSYEEIVEKAKSLNYAYIGFADHNPKQSGQTDEGICTIMKERKQYIDKVLRTYKIPYFIGLEVDILPSGEIALPTKAFQYVNYLIVSIHSSFNQSRVQMTERVLKALSYPKVKIFGHPTARLIGKRSGIELDWRQIFDHVKDHHQALEINSCPSRLDLPDSLVKEAKENGVKFFVNTDTHAVEHMDWMRNGVGVARRGWLEARDVVNTWRLEKVREWVESAKS